MKFDINEMTPEEKLQAMEMLWEDFCRRSPNFQSPRWHADVLESREKRLREGKERAVDWEQAKKEIKESLQ